MGTLALLFAAVLAAQVTGVTGAQVTTTTQEPATTVVVTTTEPTTTTLPRRTTTTTTTPPPPTTATTEPATEPPAQPPGNGPGAPRTIVTIPRTTTTVAPPPPPDVASGPAPPVGPPVAAPRVSSGAIQSDKQASEPGGVVTLTGGGCTPNAPVTVAVGDRVIGTIAGTPDGKFIAILTLPQLLDVGRYDVTITCGISLSTPVDIVVASHLDSGNSVLALFIFFVLMVIALFRRRRLVARPARAGDAEVLQP